MFRFIRNYSGPILWSTLLHAGVFVLLVFGLSRAVQPRRAPEATVKASVITERLDVKPIELADETEELEQQRLEAEAERARRAEEERRRQVELEQKRQEEEAQRQAELERKREEEEAERRRLVELERKREEEAERKRQAERERKRQEEEAERKRQAELERKRQEEEAERKRQAELEQKRQEEEARRQAEQRRRQEEERRRRAEEAELQAALLEEERRLAALDAGLLDQYRALVAQKVERNWIRPPSAGLGLDCEVHVRQFPKTGEVLSVRVARCNGDAAVVRSIEAAVQRASPLPTIAEPSLQYPDLIFAFRPEE